MLRETEAGMLHIYCDNCDDHTYYADIDMAIEDNWMSVINKEGKPCYLCPECAGKEE